MGFFSSRKSLRGISNSIGGPQEVTKPLAASKQHHDQDRQPHQHSHVLRSSSSEAHLRPLRHADTQADRRRQTLYLDSRAQECELTPFVQHQSQNLAGRLEELAAAYKANIIDDEAYRILRQTAFSTLVAASTVPTPKSIGHVPELDVPMLDPSQNIQPITAQHASPNSVASKRSSSSIASVFARFRRNTSSRHEASLSRAAESDRDSIGSSVAVEVPRVRNNMAGRTSFYQQSPVKRTGGTFSRSNSTRRQDRTPPPSAYRFHSDDAGDGDGHPPLPDASSSSAWISDDATPAVIKLEIQRLEAEAARLEASFRDAETALRQEMEALESSISSHPSLRAVLAQAKDAPVTARSTGSTQNVRGQSKSENFVGRSKSQSSLKSSSEGHHDANAVERRLLQVDQRRVEAGNRYARRIEFLSARLLAAELRRQVRR